MTIQLKTELPGPASKKLMEERRKHVARGPFQATPIFVARAHGAVIEDVDGNKLLDFACGIGVTTVGHTPESVSGAVKTQADKLLHGSFNVTPYEVYIRVAEKLNAAVPGDGPRKTLLVNSGAEAVENAIKIARAHTHRQAVVCFEHAFHGRTYMAMSLTAKAKPYKMDFGPFCSEIYRAPFPDMYRWPGGGDEEKVSAECFAKFDDLVSSQIGATNVAAVIIEPVLGEGGFMPAPVAFLKSLRQFCTQHGIVLIFDEIQSGFGRTGALFACQRLGINPDLVTTAKGLAAGLPLAAVTGKAEMMDAPIEGGVGGTYGGNPVACSAALAVFDLFQDGSLLKKAQRVEQLLSARMESWLSKFRYIGFTRGLGPMRAMELVKDRATKEPFKEAVAQLLKYCYEHGVILLSAGTLGNAVRFLVPMIISEAELQEGLDVIERGLEELHQ